MIVAILILLIIGTECRGRRNANAGVYTYTHKNTGQYAYVGTTNNFERRHREHQYADHYYASSDYNYNTYSMPGATPAERYAAEKVVTHPEANKHPGGNGPR